jgi:hypothetical protein
VIDRMLSRKPRPDCREGSKEQRREGEESEASSPAGAQTAQPAIQAQTTAQQENTKATSRNEKLIPRILRFVYPI